ncbi:MAG: hypothetical protein J7K13_03430 [Thermoplasmata archaeon]|nr:hypothetical protein [Thermoplasmata archaeon]
MERGLIKYGYIALLASILLLLPAFAMPISIKTGAKAYDEIVGFDELQENAFINIIRYETDIHNLHIIYKEKIGHNVCFLFLDKDQDVHYEAIFSERNVTIKRLELDNITIKTSSTFRRPCECFENYNGKYKDAIVAYTVEGKSETIGILHTSFGGNIRVYTREIWIEGHNILGWVVWKNCAKGRFYADLNRHRIVDVVDLSYAKTYNYFWKVESHSSGILPKDYTYYAMVRSDAYFKCWIFVNYGCDTWAWVWCLWTGAYLGDKHAECNYSNSP